MWRFYNPGRRKTVIACLIKHASAHILISTTNRKTLTISGICFPSLLTYSLDRVIGTNLYRGWFIIYTQEVIQRQLPVKKLVRKKKGQLDRIPLKDVWNPGSWRGNAPPAADKNNWLRCYNGHVTRAVSAPTRIIMAIVGSGTLSDGVVISGTGRQTLFMVPVVYYE